MTVSVQTILLIPRRVRARRTPALLFSCCHALAAVGVIPTPPTVKGHTNPQGAKLAMTAIRIGYFEASLKALKDGWEEDSSFARLSFQFFNDCPV